jgi:hypothetical protein
MRFKVFWFYIRSLWTQNLSMGGLGSVILESRIRSRLSMFKIFELFWCRKSQINAFHGILVLHSQFLNTNLSMRGLVSVIIESRIRSRLLMFKIFETTLALSKLNKRVSWYFGFTFVVCEHKFKHGGSWQCQTWSLDKYWDS